MFDRYVSLGQDCEVGFQLKRVLGAQQTSFFNWNITGGGALVALLRHDFAGILQPDNLSLHGDGGLVRDSVYDYFVHHEFDTAQFKQAPDFAARLEQLQAKFGFFVELFRKSAATPGRTAYFYKSTDPTPKNLALAVQQLLTHYHGANPFDLIILQTRDKQEADWALPGIHNRYLRRFAAYDDTPDGHVPTWDAVFREFPHHEPMKLVNY